MCVVLVSIEQDGAMTVAAEESPSVRLQVAHGVLLLHELTLALLGHLSAADRTILDVDGDAIGARAFGQEAEGAAIDGRRGPLLH